ncbi:hypothetical protein ACGF1Z_03395 [Streptomyces sp. NPDC048018]|uniref:hypothetical protein n=1 Tax=Streptomyces sp. NPDC048018 TaxID=3365499 RepID=UPI003712D2B9
MHVGRERHSRTRAGGALAHLLLVVVLALGVFVMHSVGHPAGSSGGGTDGMAHVATATGLVPAEGSADAAGVRTAASAPERHHGGGHGKSASHHPGGSGTDMTTLCVAVLGAWLLLALVRAALARRPDRTAALPAGLLPALGPNAPPPRPPDLAQLSILRI